MEKEIIKAESIKSKYKEILLFDSDSHSHMIKSYVNNILKGCREHKGLTCEESIKWFKEHIKDFNFYNNCSKIKIKEKSNKKWKKKQELN